MDEVRGDYWARIVTKTPKGEEAVDTKRGHTKLRSFKEVQDGIAAGYEYADPITALTMRLTHGVETISDASFFKQIKALGETPSQRLQQRSQDLIANYRNLRAAYRDARKTGDEATQKNLAERLQQARVDLRTAQRKVAEPRIGEMKRYGRIYPEEVVKALDSYMPEDPGVIDQIFGLYRASMVTGDWSHFGVQGYNMLTRRPLEGLKATAYGVVSTFTTPEGFVASHWDTVLDGIRSGAITPPSEFLLEAGGPCSCQDRQVATGEANSTFV